MQADVSRSDEVERLVRSAEDAFGTIDILVNNAGIARLQSIDQVTESDWDDLYVTNLKSCFLVTQAVLPGMRAQKWGRIINLSSVAASGRRRGRPHYAATKAGMLGLTHYYAAHLTKEGITANAIAPALIETEMVRFTREFLMRASGRRSDGPIWNSGRGSGCCADARPQWIHKRTDHQHQWRARATS